MATATTSTGMPYSGNADFRGYVAAVAPQYLPLVGNDGGINPTALQNFVLNNSGSNTDMGMTSGKVQQDIADLVNKYTAFQTAPATGTQAQTTKADPNLDPTHIAELKGTIGTVMDAVRAAIASAFGKVDASAQDKAKQLNDQYVTSQAGLDTNFGNTAQGIDNTESARGAFNSSYRAKQQGAAQDAYQLATTQMAQGKTADMAKVGQTAAVEKAQLSADQPTYNPGDYNTVSDLLNVKNAVDTALGNINVSAAGIDTQGGFVDKLKSIAPSASDTGSSALKAQLDKLAGTTAPNDAKTVIAQHAINQAGADPAWLDYFQSQLAGNGSTPSSVVTGAAASM